MAKRRKVKKKRPVNWSADNGTVTRSEVVSDVSKNVSTNNGTAAQRVSKREQRRATQAKAIKLKRIRVIGLAVISVILVFAAVTFRNSGVVPGEDLRATLPPNIEGTESAAVNIVEFGDFGCPSCRAWHNSGIREKIMADFDGQVSFEFRHFPVITAASPKAAEAAQCAAEQGAFWQYHDYVYEQAPPGSLGVADLKSYATAIGLAGDSFDSCLESGKYQDYVTQDMQDAIAAGARGTPSFFIGEQPVSFSFAGMSAAIQEALAN